MILIYDVKSIHNVESVSIIHDQFLQTSVMSNNNKNNESSWANSPLYHLLDKQMNIIGVGRETRIINDDYTYGQTTNMQKF